MTNPDTMGIVPEINVKKDEIDVVLDVDGKKIGVGAEVKPDGTAELELDTDGDGKPDIEIPIKDQTVVKAIKYGIIVVAVASAIAGVLWKFGVPF